MFYSTLPLPPGWETGGVELASTITLVLQANRLTKCASHPKWWWQFECKETYTRVNYHIRLRCKYHVYAGSCVFEYMCRLFYYLRESKLRKSSSEPSKVVISLEPQSLDLALKSPIMTVRNGFDLNSKDFRFDLNVLNSTCVWLGGLKRWMKRQTLLRCLHQVMHSLRYEIFNTLKGRVVLQKLQIPPFILLKDGQRVSVTYSNQVFLSFGHLWRFRKQGMSQII